MMFHKSLLTKLRRNSLWSVLVLCFGVMALLISSCNTTEENGHTYLKIHVDSTWLAYDSIQIFLDKGDGSEPDFIFSGKVEAISDLERVQADGYDGKNVTIIIQGYKNGNPIREENRKYDGDAQATTEKVDVIPPINNVDTTQVLVLAPDSLKLYTGGGKGRLTLSPASWAGKTLEWSSSDTTVALVNDGEVSPIKAGTALIRVRAANAKDSARIRVVTDAPVLSVGEDTAVSLGSSLAFVVKATQEYGVVEMFKWSLDGDSVWDDSSSQFPAGQTEFSTVGKTFSASGSYSLYFLIRDGEGNTVTATRKLTISKQVPSVDLLNLDTTITVGDSLDFSAKAEVNTGVLKTFSWDYNGDGTAEQAGDLADSKATIKGGYRFNETGTFDVLLTVKDDVGTSVSAQVIIEVNSIVQPKPPAADAGQDTAVLVGKRVDLHGTGSDPDGTIVKREWRIGSGSFTVVSKGDTSFTAPNLAGPVTALFRVTDNNGLSDVDTVTVIVSDAEPPILSSVLPGDTVISIKDSLTFSAKAASTSPLKGFSWDFNGDGTADASDILAGNSGAFFTGRRFGATGVYNVILKVETQDGGVATKSIKVNVKLDEPQVNAGKDTTVAEVSTVNLHGTAFDTLGTIVKYEWKIGSGVYSATATGDTSFTAPKVPGIVTCLLRVTDDDGLTSEDTVKVNVAANIDATLSKLDISLGTLSPAFTSATKAYIATVTAGDSLTITATASFAKASLKLNGAALESGKASSPMPLVVGANVFTLDVTAEDNTTTATYTVTATRLADVPPTAPTVKATISQTALRTVIWTWSAGGGGNGSFRYKLDDADLTTGATTTTALKLTGKVTTDGSHVLYVQERNAAGTWSKSGKFAIDVLAPIEWYPLNGNATDLGLNGNDGVITGLTSTTDHSGTANSALTFDGTGKITTGTAATATGSKMTVAMWIKFPAGTALQYFISNTGGIGIWTRTGSVGLAISTPSTNSASGAVAADTWAHFIGTYDGTTIKAYINGVLTSSASNPGTISGALSNLVIGATGWTGALDDIRFYNQTLTQTQITALYQGNF